MIAGILEPTEGNIYFDNLNYANNEIEIKQNIAYLSGNTKLYDTLSAYELLKMCSDIYGVQKEESEKRIQEITKILKMKLISIYSNDVTDCIVLRESSIKKHK